MRLRHLAATSALGLVALLSVACRSESGSGTAVPASGASAPVAPAATVPAAPAVPGAPSGNGGGGGEPTRTASAATATETGGTGLTGPAATAPPGAASVEPRPVNLAPISDRVWGAPTEMGAYPSATGGRAGYFVAEQDGVLHEVAANGAATPILDLRDRVSRAGNEEGLLSVALDPAFAANRRVWAYYAAANPRRTVLARFTREAGSGTIDRGSQAVVLEVAQPFPNHKGGAIRFGPDGMLYLGLGDGGSAGDPNGNGQNLGALLGKIIRIDVRNSTADRPYAVPLDNPFVDRAGARGEIWAYGLRNPWRMSFDSATGWLWAGDVGQDAVEEIDVIGRGANFGWNVVEGDRCYRPSTGCDRTGFTPPVIAYAHAEGRCSIVGGVVYRGARVPEIAGAYLYGDTCSGEVWAVNAANPRNPVRIATGARALASFGIDADGEVTLLAFGQSIRRITSKS